MRLIEKPYLEQLEDRVDELTEINSNILQENCDMKDKLERYPIFSIIVAAKDDSKNINYYSINSNYMFNNFELTINYIKKYWRKIENHKKGFQYVYIINHLLILNNKQFISELPQIAAGPCFETKKEVDKYIKNYKISPKVKK